MLEISITTKKRSHKLQMTSGYGNDLLLIVSCQSQQGTLRVMPVYAVLSREERATSTSQLLSSSSCSVDRAASWRRWWAAIVSWVLVASRRLRRRRLRLHLRPNINSQSSTDYITVSRFFTQRPLHRRNSSIHSFIHSYSFKELWQNAK